MFEEADVFWFEEPLPAEDITGHARLASSTGVPVAVGESSTLRVTSASTCRAEPRG